MQNFPGLRVVAEACNDFEALEMIRTHQPDVVLMDLGMSGMNGLEATARVKREFPHTRVIILSMHEHEDYVDKALRVGAAGYVLQDSLPAELEQAIEAVAEGQNYLSPRISQQVGEKYQKYLSGDPAPPEELTPRQRDVLGLIAQARSNKQDRQAAGPERKDGRNAPNSVDETVGGS